MDDFSMDSKSNNSKDFDVKSGECGGAIVEDMIDSLANKEDFEIDDSI